MSQVSGGAQWGVRKGGTDARMARGYFYVNASGLLEPTKDLSLATHQHVMNSQGEVTIGLISEPQPYGRVRTAIQRGESVIVYGTVYLGEPETSFLGATFYPDGA